MLPIPNCPCDQSQSCGISHTFPPHFLCFLIRYSHLLTVHLLYVNAVSINVIVQSTVQVASEGEENADEDTEVSRHTPLEDRQLGSAAGHVYGLEEDEIDTRAFIPAAGGLVMIELLKLPPQPKSINGWTIRQGDK